MRRWQAAPSLLQLDCGALHNSFPSTRCQLKPKTQVLQTILYTHTCMHEAEAQCGWNININKLHYFTFCPARVAWCWLVNMRWKDSEERLQCFLRHTTWEWPSQLSIRWIETLQKNELLSIFQSKFPSVLVFLQCHFHITESCFAIEFLK